MLMTVLLDGRPWVMANANDETGARAMAAALLAMRERAPPGGGAMPDPTPAELARVSARLPTWDEEREWLGRAGEVGTGVSLAAFTLPAPDPQPSQN